MGIAKNSYSLFFNHLKLSLQLFQKNDPLRLAGATAFFANFALPPILIIFIRLFGFFIDRNFFSMHLFIGLGGMLDDSSTAQIIQTLKNIRGIDQSWWATILSFFFFIFVATTLFAVIKNSMDQIWSIGLNDKTGILFKLKMRARSMVIILLAGILFLLGIVADSMQALIGAYLNTAAPTVGKIFLKGF